MSVTLTEAKLYLRIDSAVEDTLLTDIVTAAESYLRDAVDDYDTFIANTSDTNFAAKAKIAQLALITEMYDNRYASVHQDFSYTVRSLITQMQYYTSTGTTS